MKKILKSLLFIGIFVVSILGTQNVFADPIKTPSKPEGIYETEATFILKIDQKNMKEAGILISESEEGLYSFPSCKNLVSEKNEFLSLKDYGLRIKNLKENTKYFYMSCITGSTLENYEPGEIEYFTTLEKGTTLKLETANATNVAGEYTPITLSGKVNTKYINKAGFKFSIKSQLKDVSCDYSTEIIKISGIQEDVKIYTDIRENVLPETTYFYQACGKDSSGKELLGKVESLTTKKKLASNSKNCLIDYVEFTPYNKSVIGATPENPRFETFIIGEGKEVRFTIYPYNKDECVGVPIHTIWLVNYSKGKDDINVEKYIVDTGENKTFSDEGTFSGRLVAGDKNCNSEKICTLDLAIVYGVWPANAHLKSPANARTFLSSRSSDYSSYSTGSTQIKRDKGTLYYRAKNEDKYWRIFEEGKDPTYEEIQKGNPDSNSPCYVKTGKLAGQYDPNCYEFLAPIPGIEKNDSGIVNEDGRVAITNIKDYKLGNYINTLFQLAVSLLAIISVIMIVVAGVQYMTVESIYGKSDAKQRIIGAVSGLILALGIYLILWTINPKLLEVNFGDGIETVSIDIEQGDGVMPGGSGYNVTEGTKTKACPEGITLIDNIGVCKTISEKFKKLMEDSKKAGISLGGWGARTYQKQVELRKKNCKNPNFDIYNGSSKECTPNTARPGYSNHESGFAIDFTCNGSTIKTENECFNWLKNNQTLLKNYPAEKWHWSINGR